MEMLSSLDKKVASQLVIQFGFSRRNAEIAIEMFRVGELNRSEEEVINRIYLFPDFEDQLLTYYKSDDKSIPVAWVADHLNYRITLAGGDRVTKSSVSTSDCGSNLMGRILARHERIQSFPKSRSARRRRT